MEEGDLIAGKYELLQHLADGGMGEVWRARNRLTLRPVALKVLLPGLIGNEEAEGRFLHEVRTAGQLRHPSIVEVLDAGFLEAGRPFLVMELLEGESLEQRIARDGALDVPLVAALFAQLTRALATAHRAGIVHRDLSSPNVFLARPIEGGVPVPKLIDFGVSKLLAPVREGGVVTRSGAVLGSPEYMSPEQAAGAEQVDARSDVWSLAVLMYEALTGAPPFTASNYNALILRIVGRPHEPLLVRRPEVEPELAALIEHCLQKDPEQRVQSAAEVAEVLERIARRIADPELAISSTRKRRATDRLAMPHGPPRRREPERRPMALRLTALSSALSACIGLAVGMSAHTAPDRAPRQPVARKARDPEVSSQPPMLCEVSAEEDERAGARQPPRARPSASRPRGAQPTTQPQSGPALEVPSAALRPNPY